MRWTLEQLKTRLPSMVKQAGYDEIAGRIDQQAMADHLTQLEPEILAKYYVCNRKTWRESQFIELRSQPRLLREP